MFYINRADIERSILSISKDLSVTRGEFLYPATASVSDLDWNHMDWAHRPLIHRTYLNALRLYSDKNCAVSITQVKYLGLDVFVQVTDMKIAAGLFYQCYSVFGLIFVHGVLENKEKDTVFTWYLASSRWLKPFHKILSRKIGRLVEQQVNEDAEIRTRRTQLRNIGYSFPPEERDYLSSSDSLMHTRYPPLMGEWSFNLDHLTDGQNTTVNCGETKFLIEKNKLVIKLWPEVCPHEGGQLAYSNKCTDGSITCPWHGLKFKAVEVGSKEVSIYGARFCFENNTLKIN